MRADVTSIVYRDIFIPEENDCLKKELYEHFLRMDFYLGGLGHGMNLTRDFVFKS